jgi:hypothetical protein
MTDPIVSLETTQLTVEPGGQGRTLVTVRNLGTIVEGFALQVLGEGVAEWAEVTPPEVQIYPDQEATAVVVFSPPAGTTTRSGTFPFAVRAESVVNPETSAVAEGDLEIGRVFGLQAKITPVTSSGRWRGKHFMEITNWGNAPVQLKLTAADPDQKLAFLIGPEVIDLPLGVTGHARLRVRTLSPFLRGAQVRLPFQVVGEPDPPEVPTGPPSMLPNPRRVAMDGAFVQRPILSKLTVTVAVLAVALVAGLIAFLVTRGPDQQVAGLEQGPPRTPELTAAAKDSTSIQLNWQSQPNIQTYRVNQLTPEGSTTGVTPVDGQLDAFVVEKLQPQTAYCFQLQAVRGDQVSGLSAQQCATTAAAPPASASPSPSAVASSAAVSPPASPPVSAPVAPESIAPPSVPASGPPSGGVIAPVVPGGGGAAPGAPSTAAGGGAPPPPSGSGGAAASSPVATAGGSLVVFAPTDFIDVVFTVPAADAEAANRAEAQRAQLAAAGVAAAVLRSSDYPQLRIAGAAPLDSYLVYVGPFPSEQDARARCTANPPVGAFCLPIRPSPGG